MTAVLTNRKALMTFLLKEANGAYAGLPQYEGYFDDWIPVQVEAVEYKGGDLPHTLTIASPELRTEAVLTGRGSETKDVTYVTVFNVSNCHICSIPVGKVAFL